MPEINRFIPFAAAVLFTIPGFLLRLFHPEVGPVVTVLAAGTAILAASFLLLWACDAAQKDISQALALAVVALIAVLPEYAVDMYFTWQAGRDPGSDYAQYAVANMTGANRLMIGLAWTMVVVIFRLRTGKAVELAPERRTEIAFLGLATFYAFLIPIKGTLAWYDGLVFACIYVLYMRLAGRRPCVDEEPDGPAELLTGLPVAKRRAATLALFLFSAGAILCNAEPFSEGLVATGRMFGINEFLLVQWLAPIASEAPEFTVAIMFALRGRAEMAFGSLLSSKLNQWTLLVGMIPLVYGVSSGSFSTPIPMGSFQMHEILLTAAQSLLAVLLIAGLRLGAGGALLLLSLFLGQLITPVLMESLKGVLPWHPNPEQVHLVFTGFYLAASACLLILRRRDVVKLTRGFSVERIASPGAKPVT